MRRGVSVAVLGGSAVLVLPQQKGYMDMSMRRLQYGLVPVVKLGEGELRRANFHFIAARATVL